MTLDDDDDGGWQTVTGLIFWEYAKSNKNTSHTCQNRCGNKDLILAIF